MKSRTIYRIAITGPESSGKSSLAKQLAKHFKTIWVPEYSREYLKDLGRKYQYDDILAIAKGQYESEKQLESEASGFLFTDTDFIVSKIWCDDKFGKCHPWIMEMIESHPYDLYLLCNIDLPWEADTLRENPGDRDRLFELYKKELEIKNLPYVVISGHGKVRLNEAVRSIQIRFQN